ncbi:hypothetical protein KKB71_00735 [Patescibacteria group bacterium]|nr:hypothetical protein [Patescibacteria group bacterium]
MEQQSRRNKIIEAAVEAADHIILDGFDGSVEETNYLIAEVARRFMKKALMPFQQQILYKDIER